MAMAHHRACRYVVVILLKYSIWHQTTPKIMRQTKVRQSKWWSLIVIYLMRWTSFNNVDQISLQFTKPTTKYVCYWEFRLSNSQFWNSCCFKHANKQQTSEWTLYSAFATVCQLQQNKCKSGLISRSRWNCQDANNEYCVAIFITFNFQNEK